MNMDENVQLRNAKITGFSLGYEDHGILTMSIGLDYGGAGQSFGGYSLDGHNGERSEMGRRIGCAWGMEFVAQVLKTVGVDDIKALVGKPIRVKATNSHVLEIGHFIENKWFRPERDLAFLAPKEGRDSR